MRKDQLLASATETLAAREQVVTAFRTRDASLTAKVERLETALERSTKKHADLDDVSKQLQQEILVTAQRAQV